MVKKSLILLFVTLCFFLSLAVKAETLEEAFQKNNYVFLYFYTPECGYCTKFSPKYDKLSKMYASQLAFVKINATTKYGYNLLKQFKINYVPYVLLIDKKNNIAIPIETTCLSDMACIEKNIRRFRK